MQQLSLQDFAREIKACRFSLLLIFDVAFVFCLLYSLLHVSSFYMKSIEIALPANIEINTANTATNILSGAVFMPPIKHGTPGFTSTLSVGGNSIYVRFYGSDETKVEDYSELYLDRSITALKNYIRDSVGEDKTKQVKLISSNKEYRGNVVHSKSINLLAMVVASLVCCFVYVTVQLTWRKKRC